MHVIAPAAFRAGLAGILLRRLRAEDREGLAAHLLGLSEADRIARFDGACAASAICGRCAALDLALGGEDIAYGAFAGPRMVGAALAFRCADGAEEVAVTVDAAWRRRRLASNLVAQACAAAAREHGATRALFCFNPANIAVQNLVRHLGGVPRPLDGIGEVPIAA